MRRRFFTILSGLSLVMCTLTVVIWVRSQFVTDFVGKMQADPQHTNAVRFGVVEWQRGVFLVAYGRTASHWVPFSRPLHHGWFLTHMYVRAYKLGARQGWWGECGLEWDRSTGTDPYTDISTVTAPCWLLVALTAFLPAIHGLKLFPPCSRGAYGRCRTCGYDLRATPERCPECGSIPAGTMPSA